MRFVLLLIAAVIAVVAGVAALQWSGKMNAPVPAPTAQAPAMQNVSTVDVLVARGPIAVGAVIDDSMVDKQPGPEHLVLDNFIVVGGKNSDIAGKVARAPLQAHEPLTIDKLANPNDPSFLAATLPPGKRAVTIATDAISGVAGYVFPGDHVDVLFTHNVPQDIKADNGLGARATPKPAVSEVLVPNLRVLAVNVRDTGGRGSQQTTVPSSITFEVTNLQAEKIRLAEKVGTLSVALRSLKDMNATAGTQPMSLQTLVQKPKEGPKGDTIRIVRGAGSTQTSAMGRAMSGGMAPAEPE